MLKITGKFRTGKTVALIRLCSAANGVFVVGNKVNRNAVKKEAANMNITLRALIVANNEDSLKGRTGLFVDDAGIVIDKIGETEWNTLLLQCAISAMTEREL